VTLKEIKSGRTFASIVKFSTADLLIAAIIDQWDADPWLLNTPGGVVDLHTGEMRAHKRGQGQASCAFAAPSRRAHQVLQQLDKRSANAFAGLRARRASATFSTAFFTAVAGRLQPLTPFSVLCFSRREKPYENV
jgi:hypothetical protein